MKKVVRHGFFLFLLIGVSCGTYQDVFFASTAIKLPREMYTVSGERVKAIRLSPGEAAILQDNDPRNKVNASFVPLVPRPNKTVRLGGYFFGGFEEKHQLSQRQLSWIASNLDVLSLNPNYVTDESPNGGGIKPENVVWLKQNNSKLKFYCMLFATTLREPRFDPAIMSDWVLKNKDGTEAWGVRRNDDADKDHLMDLGNEEYAEYFRKFVVEHANEFHADGVAIDEIMWNGYWGVNVEQLKDYTSVEQIRFSCYKWLESVAGQSPKEVIHQAFWPEAQKFTNGVWGEVAFVSWWRADKKYEIFYEEMDYNDILMTISEYGMEGKTYVWAAYYGRDSESELEYSVATYLLGKNGEHVVFHPQPVYDGGYPNNLGGYNIQTVMEEYESKKHIFNVELGNPIGDFYIERIRGDNIWVRQYEAGMVYVNPNKKE